MSLRGPGIFNAFYGDASDGDIVITGSVTLLRDTFFNNVWMTSSLNRTPTVFTNNFRMFVAGQLVYFTSGTIDNSGVPGQTGAGGSGPGGAAIVGGSLQSGGSGGSGSVGNGQPGFPPATLSASFGGTGGNGGTGGGTSAGAGGIASPIQPSSGSVRTFYSMLTGYMFGPGGPYGVAGGGGGGAGGGAGAVQGGGGGGACGGPLLLAAREIISYIPSGSIVLLPVGSFSWLGGLFVNPVLGPLVPVLLSASSPSSFSVSVIGTVQSNGGAGGNGQTGGVTGGGGGGGGGPVLVVSSRQTGSLAIQSLGGPGGSSNGGGGVGSVGSTGSVFNLPL